MKIHQAANQIKKLTQLFSDELNGCEAIVRSRGAGKYRDRLGRICGVIPDHRHGLSVLVMIYALGTKRVLNSAPETRTYWPWDEIEVQS